jgi:predicted lipoprotein with Yx(FWY)xxD motif
MPGALLIGAFVFLLAAGWQRQMFNEFKLSHAGESQYLYIFAGMALPALAVAIDAIVRRWRPLVLVALAPLLIGIPGNYQAFATGPDGLYQTAADVSYRQTIVALATVPVAREIPPSTQIGDLTSLFRPEPPPLDVTLGWLLDQKASGRLPDVGTPDPRVEADATLALALRQSQSASNSLNTGATSATQPTPPAPAAPSAGPPLVRIVNNPKDGQLLANSYGMTLYTLTVGPTPIPCAAGCAGTWRALLAPTRGVAPTGGPGVAGLGTSASGTVVTYFGYPLFLYSGDKLPGQTAGDGIKTAGGTWHTIRVQAPKTCGSLTAPTTKVLQKGQSLTFTGALGVIYLSDKGQSDETIFQPTYGQVLSALAGPLTLQLLPIGGSTSVCV